MMVNIDTEDLLKAIDMVSSSEQCGIEMLAYICTKSGKVWVTGTGKYCESELPADLSDNEQYILAPDKRELPLGRNVALNFIKASLPEELERVYGFFRRKGAYANFKHLLAQSELLDSWYEYEELQTTLALQQWCNGHNLALSSLADQLS